MKINGLLFAVAVVFVTLKLAGAVAWSWWLVLLPMWIGPAIVLGVVVLVFCAAGVVALVREVAE